jgi:nucleoside-diphosphate-sugar epimerase
MDDLPVVIVTGASGFIGSALVNRLAGQFTIVGFDRVASHQPPPDAECVCIDLTSDEGVDAAFERVRIAYGNRIASVIHLAAYYDLSGEPNPEYEKITVRGTERLLRYLRQFEVEQFIFSSTMLVHAPTEPGEPITESSPIDPRWPYPMSKVETEALIREQHGDIPVVLLRLAGVYDDDGRNTFLAHQIARIRERDVLGHFYPGDIRRGQAFVHMEDVCDALLRLIEKRKTLPSEFTLLVGEPDTMSYGEVQQTVAQTLHGDTWETKQVPKPFAKIGAWFEDEVLDEDSFIKPWMVDLADDHYELDVTRARTTLDWVPAHSLRDSLPVILDALKSAPTRWYGQNRLNEALVAGETRAASPESPVEARQIQEVAAQQRASRKHAEMMSAEHRRTLWTHFVNIGLGAWLVASPFVFGMFDTTFFVSPALQHVTVDRGLASPQWRAAMLGWSDVVSGALVMLFGTLSLSRRTSWAPWVNAVVGLWLLFAPLVFWAPGAAAYNNDLVIGMLVIALAVLVPMMPGMSMEGMMDTSTVPPGWTYCPSTWTQRLPIIAMGLVGLIIARQLTHHVRCFESVAHSGCGIGRRQLRAGNPHGRDGKSYTLAHNALDGDLLRHPGGSARHREYLLHRHPADRNRYLVHTLPACRPGNAGHDSLCARRTGGNGTVSALESPRRQAVLANLPDGRRDAGRRRGDRGRARVHACGLHRHGTRSDPSLDAGGQRRDWCAADVYASALRNDRCDGEQRSRRRCARRDGRHHCDGRGCTAATIRQRDPGCVAGHCSVVAVRCFIGCVVDQRRCGTGAGRPESAARQAQRRTLRRMGSLCLVAIRLPRIVNATRLSERDLRCWIGKASCAARQYSAARRPVANEQACLTQNNLP